MTRIQNQTKGMDVNHHFHLTVEMVKLDSGAYRSVENLQENCKKKQLSEKFR